jgi:O-antigen biosynthesis protein
MKRRKIKTVRKISLAIPTHNSLKFLKKYLPFWVKQGFYLIYILDDASADNTVQWAKKRFPELIYIQNKKQLGPTATRNLVLDQDMGDAILFADSDIQPIGNNIPKKIAEVFNNNKSEIVGGLVFTEKNEPMWWNFGHESNPIIDAKAAVFHKLALDFFGDKKIIGWIKKNAKEYTMNFYPRKEQKVDWVVEMFFSVRADIFKKYRGFDENFVMFHEGPDLCKRIREKGGEVLFTPKIKAVHHNLHSRSLDRHKQFIDSSKYWYKKHYNMPEAIFDKLIKSLYERSNSSSCGE